jgi:DNA-binding transcriptional ArsR family regulator
MDVITERIGPDSVAVGWHIDSIKLAGPATVHPMVNDAFHSLGHPLRRRIVERLAHGPATVGVATRGLGVSKPAITKHLKVLEDGGVVVRTVEGRTHRLGLDAATLRATSDWLDRQRAAWDLMFDAVEAQLRVQSETPGGRA